MHFYRVCWPVSKFTDVPITTNREHELGFHHCEIDFPLQMMSCAIVILFGGDFPLSSGSRIKATTAAFNV